MSVGGEQKREEKGKNKKYRYLCFELLERRSDYEVKVILSVTKYLGGGMKNLKENVKLLFENEKELEQTICDAMQVKCNSCTMEE